MTSSGVSSASEWRQHGWVLLPAFFGVMLGTVHHYSTGVMMVPLEQEFGWTRAEIASGPFLIAFITLIGAPLVGIGIDRLGPRRVGLFGVFIFCAAFAFLSTTTSDIWSWWLRWILVGIASAFVLPPIWTAAVNSLYSKNRGKALAFTMTGIGAGAALVPAAATELVHLFGWRTAYVSLGGLSALVVAPLIYFFFYGARDPRGAAGTPVAHASAAIGYSVREGFASPKFIMLCSAVLITGVTSVALATTAVPILLTKGLDSMAAAGVAGLIGVGSILGRLGGGFLLDYFEARKVAAASILAPIVTVSILILMPESPVAVGAACLLLGLALGTEVDACSYLAARYFGIRSFGVLFGTINGVSMFGSGLAPVAANHVYDITKSYDPVLWAVVPMCLLASLLFMLLGDYPDFGQTAENEDKIATAE